MRSRGQFLPLVPAPPVQEALPALASWLDSEGPKDMLAIGPLTNLALAYQSFPDKLQRLRSLTWMGGSRAKGNHTEHAEYNAFADADALATVLQHGAPLRIVDLELCRQVTFGPADAPVLEDGLLADLLGGYLDIALSRGRERMAIYDPIAALAVVHPSLIKFERVNLSVYTENDARYGQTEFNFVQPPNASIGTGIDPKIALQICMKALKQRQNQ
jgi:inosine-uridine nucleoside N-ribohydrolase